jgi:hypothetical protein
VKAKRNMSAVAELDFAPVPNVVLFQLADLLNRIRSCAPAFLLPTQTAEPVRHGTIGGSGVRESAQSWRELLIDMTASRTILLGLTLFILRTHNATKHYSG